jgi:tRNA nucleotidyltransferase (CCA-adding enzyme)
MLRAVGDPIERFTEDGLRPLRAVRFATVLDLHIDPPTLAAIPQTADTFRKVSAERVRVELVKTLASPRAAWGMALLRDCTLLAECWPQLAALDERTWTRTLTALEAAPADLVIRLAVLFHEVGPGAGAALKRLRFANVEVKGVAHLHAYSTLDPARPRSDAEVRRTVADVGRDALDALVAYRRAWDDDVEWSRFEERVAQTGARDGPHAPRELAISGRDVMSVTGIPPSPRVGRILQALLERVWVDPTLNTPEGLRALVAEVEPEVPEK